MKALGKDCGDGYRSLDLCQKLEDREDCRKGTALVRTVSLPLLWSGKVELFQLLVECSEDQLVSRET